MHERFSQVFLRPSDDHPACFMVVSAFLMRCILSAQGPTNQAPTLLDLSRQLDTQADMILSSAYNGPITMMAPMDPRLVHLGSTLPAFSTSALPLNLHQAPSFSLGLPQSLTAWPLSCPPIPQQQQAFHIGIQGPSIQQGSYSYLTPLEQGPHVLAGGHDSVLMLERATRKAPRGKSAITAGKMASDASKLKHSTQSRRITPRLSELLTPSSVPAMPAQTLGKRPSQYILDLKEKITRLRLRKTEMDVRVNMLQDENMSLSRQYQQLIDTFGAGRFNMTQPASINNIQGIQHI